MPITGTNAALTNTIGKISVKHRRLHAPRPA